MALGYGTLGQGSQAESAVDRGAVSSATMALSEARQLAGRIDELVGRLCGHLPRAVQDGSTGKPPSASVFHELRQNADLTLEVVRDAYAQLDRLAREVE